jgi:fructokinase
LTYDVTTFGELVVDLLPFSGAADLTFVAKPGGAPANVAAGVARLGLKAAMITKVGDDAFGRAAVRALAATGVATDAITTTRSHNTALAVVTRAVGGDAEYLFYRENCADAQLDAKEIPARIIAASRVIHFGTLALATPSSAAAQRQALSLAKARGVVVSTDPNFRSNFWRDRETMRQAGFEMIRAANVIKLSRDELSLLAGGGESAEAAQMLWHPGLLLLAVTDGSRGAEVFTSQESVRVSAPAVAAIDTVGCGDAFTASMLASLVRSGMQAPGGKALREMAIRACTAGAIVARRPGAMESMPSWSEIDAFV